MQVVKQTLKLFFVSALSYGVCFVILMPATHAAPYGKGVFGENVPYGSQTSLSLSTTGNVSIQVTPTDNGTLGTATNTVTVASTDVVGYKLYIRSVSSTNMTNGAANIPASANVSPAALSADTWGYNTTGTTDFTGTSTSDSLIKTANGPYTAGDDTIVTYGVNVTNAKPAGNYTTSIMYTAVPQTD